MLERACLCALVTLSVWVALAASRGDPSRSELLQAAASIAIPNGLTVKTVKPIPNFVVVKDID